MKSQTLLHPHPKHATLPFPRLLKKTATASNVTFSTRVKKLFDVQSNWSHFIEQYRWAQYRARKATFIIKQSCPVIMTHFSQWGLGLVSSSHPAATRLQNFLEASTLAPCLFLHEWPYIISIPNMTGTVLHSNNEIHSFSVFKIRWTHTPLYLIKQSRNWKWWVNKKVITEEIWLKFIS